VNVTANSVEVTGSAQGVWQFCPVGNRASAPCGLESNWSVVGAGSDAMNDGAPGMLEQAETPRPQAAMMTMFLMVASTRSCGWPPRHGHARFDTLSRGRSSPTIQPKVNLPRMG
jgi:hypothetical protein